MLCNWFKVDAISPVPLKGGLKKISFGSKTERKRKRMNEGRRKKGKTRLFICLCPEGCVVSHNDGARSIVWSAAYQHAMDQCGESPSSASANTRTLSSTTHIQAQPNAHEGAPTAHDALSFPFSHADTHTSAEPKG